MKYIKDNLFNTHYKDAIFDVCSLKEFPGVFSLREKCFSKDKSYLLNLNSENEVTGQDQYDSHSILYKVELEKRYIGSCRVTPLSKFSLKELAPYKQNNNILLSRVCIDADHRNNDLHLFMFYQFSNWILGNTNYTEYLAFCTTFEYRLYKKLGAKLLPENKIMLYKNQINPYHIVKGNIKEFNQFINQILTKKNDTKI